MIGYLSKEHARAQRMAPPRCFQCRLPCRGRVWRRASRLPRTLRRSCLPHIPGSYPRRTRRAPALSKRCPTVLEQLPREPIFCPLSTNIGLTLAELGEFGPKFGQLRPNLADHLPTSATCWPNSAKLGPTVVQPGQVTWPISVQLRPNMSEFPPNSASCWRNSTKIGPAWPNLAKFDQTGQTWPQTWSNSTQLRRIWPKVGPNLARIGRNFVNTCPLTGHVCKMLPSFANVCILGTILVADPGPQLLEQPFEHFSATPELAGFVAGTSPGRVTSNFATSFGSLKLLCRNRSSAGPLTSQRDDELTRVALTLEIVRGSVGPSWAGTPPSTGSIRPNLARFGPSTARRRRSSGAFVFMWLDFGQFSPGFFTTSAWIRQLAWCRRALRRGCDDSTIVGCTLATRPFARLRPDEDQGRDHPGDR